MNKSQKQYRLVALAGHQKIVDFEKQLVVRHSCQTTP
jgi:hypothetical protein